MCLDEGYLFLKEDYLTGLESCTDTYLLMTYNMIVP